MTCTPSRCLRHKSSPSSSRSARYGYSSARERGALPYPKRSGVGRGALRAPAASRDVPGHPPAYRPRVEEREERRRQELGRVTSESRKIDTESKFRHSNRASSLSQGSSASPAAARECSSLNFVAPVFHRRSDPEFSTTFGAQRAPLQQAETLPVPARASNARATKPARSYP